MRIFREENSIINHLADNTPDPPDSIFVKAVPLVNDDKIFNIIANHDNLTADQRFNSKFNLS